MKNKTQEKKPRISKLAVQTTVLLVVLFLAYDLSGIGGNIRFYGKWIACGQKPVEGGASKGGPVYYAETQTVSFLRGAQTYFCTPREAELNGHSSSNQVYEFQHLSPKEELEVRLKIIRGSR